MPSIQKNKSALAALHSKKDRAERLKKLRMLTSSETQKQLSRATLERKYGISASTLRHWEEAYGTGLTEDGAKQMVNIYQKEGIHCTIAWLLEGKGSVPVIIKKVENILTATRSSNPSETIDKECHFFKSCHAEAIVFSVKDDAMAPFYLPGDIVGGVRHYQQTMLDLVGEDCIIEAKSGDIYLRRLQKSTIADHFNLFALNPNTRIERPYLYDSEIIAAAPVVRIWRKKK